MRWEMGEDKVGFGNMDSIGGKGTKKTDGGQRMRDQNMDNLAEDIKHEY